MLANPICADIVVLLVKLLQVIPAKTPMEHFTTILTAIFPQMVLKQQPLVQLPAQLILNRVTLCCTPLVGQEVFGHL